jgi:hypothetical protein
MQAAACVLLLARPHNHGRHLPIPLPTTYREPGHAAADELPILWFQGVAHELQGPQGDAEWCKQLAPACHKDMSWHLPLWEAYQRPCARHHLPVLQSRVGGTSEGQASAAVHARYLDTHVNQAHEAAQIAKVCVVMMLTLP